MFRKLEWSEKQQGPVSWNQRMPDPETHRHECRSALDVLKFCPYPLQTVAKNVNLGSGWIGDYVV